jgi:transposase
MKSYVTRGKTVAVDAEAVCEAVRLPAVRFAEIRSEDRPALLAIHRPRDLVVRQRTRVANMIRGLRREFGHALPTGIEAITASSKRHLEGNCPDMPDLTNGILGAIPMRGG